MYSYPRAMNKVLVTEGFRRGGKFHKGSDILKKY